MTRLKPLAKCGEGFLLAGARTADARRDCAICSPYKKKLQKMLPGGLTAPPECAIL